MDSGKEEFALECKKLGITLPQGCNVIAFAIRNLAIFPCGEELPGMTPTFKYLQARPYKTFFCSCERGNLKKSTGIRLKFSRIDKFDWRVTLIGAHYTEERENFCQHKCSFCNYRAVSKAHLERHCLSHSEMRPFQCTKCGVRFKHKHGLKRHSNLRRCKVNVTSH